MLTHTETAFEAAIEQGLTVLHTLANALATERTLRPPGQQGFNGPPINLAISRNAILQTDPWED